MELSSEILEQIAFKTRSKIEEHMLVVMDKSTREEHLFQPSQTNNKQSKVAVTFPTSYNRIFNVSMKNKKFYLKKSITGGDYLIQFTLAPGAYEIENMKFEIRRIIIDEVQFTEADYPFTIKPNFTTLGSTI